ncbi:MAG TPA: DUF2914 domain-containing protein [Candidatus Paceibacterota bacterium]|nr:DUF2914 domain-containing protein [Candidatus Paceibacterota bacterium]
MFARLLAWAQKNERHLGATAFLFGFITDLLTFGLLDIAYVNLFFLGYLGLASFSTFGSHILFARRSEGQSKLERGLAILLSLAAQYAIGGILSGMLIFYTKSATLSVSWPFIALLTLVFIGNEFFRKYREHLIFQTALLFFALYAYTIFAVPIYVNALGPWVFLGSTLLAIAVFVLFLWLLAKGGATRLRESLRAILVTASITVFVVVGSYFTGVLPPLPLTLREGGIYHGLERRGGEYVLLAEAPKPWWNLRTQVVHLAPSESATAFASVFAPVRFSTSVVHHWEHYSPAEKKWTDQGRIVFGISGGRGGGYRGYSEKSNLAPGRWRVTIETLEGLAIGRIGFTVERVPAPPALHEEVH